MCIVLLVSVRNTLIYRYYLCAVQFDRRLDNVFVSVQFVGAAVVGRRRPVVAFFRFFAVVLRRPLTVQLNDR